VGFGIKGTRVGCESSVAPNRDFKTRGEGLKAGLELPGSLGVREVAVGVGTI